MLLLGLGLASLLAVQGCSAISALVHGCQSTARFSPSPQDPRVRFEPGAEAFAAAVAAELPGAVAAVEEGQYSTFRDPPTLFVCATPESFRRMTGREVKAITYRKAVFLSPRLLEEGSRVIGAYLAHELSHLLLSERLPFSQWVRVPAWFSEGLATLVSGGGGAGLVTEAEAVAAIREGRAFEPHLNAGYWDLVFPKHASHWRLEPHMFCRQSMLFVSFLKRRDEMAYRGFLTALRQGVGFRAAFENAFGADTRRLWEEFAGGLAARPL